MLPKVYRLRKNIDFRKVYRHSNSLANQYLVLYIKKNNLNKTRVGFSISKKIGKANVRNYIKRLMREVVRKIIPNIKPGYDLIFVARKKIRGKNYNDVEKYINNLLKRGKVLKDE